VKTSNLEPNPDFIFIFYHIQILISVFRNTYSAGIVIDFIKENGCLYVYKYVSAHTRGWRPGGPDVIYN